MLPIQVKKPHLQLIRTSKCSTNTSTRKLPRLNKVKLDLKLKYSRTLRFKAPLKPLKLFLTLQVETDITEDVRVSMNTMQQVTSWRTKMLLKVWDHQEANFSQHPIALHMEVLEERTVKLFAILDTNLDRLTNSLNYAKTIKWCNLLASFRNRDQMLLRVTLAPLVNTKGSSKSTSMPLANNSTLLRAGMGSLKPRMVVKKCILKISKTNYVTSWGKVLLLINTRSKLTSELSAA